MKQIFLLIAIMIMAACSVPQYAVRTSAVDLSEYNSQGFMVTTSTADVPYKSMAIVYAECSPGAVSVQHKKEKDLSDPLYSVQSKPGNYMPCYADDLVHDLVQQAKQMGANSIIDLKIESLPNDAMAASGMAVKITKQ
jgi:hypothetical protein